MEDAWFEIPYLVDAFEKCWEQTLLDDADRFGDFEKIFHKRLRQYVEKWTWIQRERDEIMVDMLDEMNDRRKRR